MSLELHFLLNVHQINNYNHSESNPIIVLMNFMRNAKLKAK